MIPYGRQTIEADDLAAVAEALSSSHLTQGPRVGAFEESLAAAGGASHAAVFANGTVALQAAYAAVGLGPGDEFVTSPITFAATANAGLWLGARPVFADIDPATGNIDPAEAARRVTKRTKAVVAVDFAGRPADYEALAALAKDKGLRLIADACHSLGARHHGRPVGSLAELTVMSFHPVKSITTGEGGAVLTSDPGLARRLKEFRQHGIVKEGLVGSPGDWYQEMRTLGVNGRLTDMQCALGLSQLAKLGRFLERRRHIARRYGQLLAGVPGLTLPPEPRDSDSSWHLYAVQLGRRNDVIRRLRELGVAAQVHYIPVYEHPYYRSIGYTGSLCPRAEEFSRRELSLPIFPLLTDGDQQTVARALSQAVSEQDESAALR